MARNSALSSTKTQRNVGVLQKCTGFFFGFDMYIRPEYNRDCRVSFFILIIMQGPCKQKLSLRPMAANELVTFVLLPSQP